MNAVRLVYEITRTGVGTLNLSIGRAGSGDDMVEQFADNLELGLKRIAKASGYDLPDADRIDDPMI